MWPLRPTQSLTEADRVLIKLVTCCKPLLVGAELLVGGWPGTCMLCGYIADCRGCSSIYEILNETILIAILETDICHIYGLLS